MNSAVQSGAPSRRRTKIVTGAAVLAATGLVASLLGGALAPPAHASDTGLIPVVTRVTGADRYEMAVNIAKRAFTGRARVIYVASGAAYPDALSAGPAAVSSEAPLLLVAPDSVPASVKAALPAMDPFLIIVVGGPSTVSDAVLAQLRATVPRADVKRISGADRYAVSRAVTADAFPGPENLAYFATGANFPDALTAGAVAGSNRSPVVLVNGAAAATDPDTADLLLALNAFELMLVGGTTSISAGIERSLPVGATVSRIEGANRYEVSLNLNDAIANDFDTVYLATGSNYPDALAGGVLAGLYHHPLYIVPPDCVPRGVLARIFGNGTQNVVLLGGPSSLGPAVEALTPCAW